MTLQIEKIVGSRALKEAFHLPHSLYKNDPYYVSPLWSDFKLLFDPKNPFYLHARADLFVAREDGRLVGSAAYIQDENFIRFHEEKTAHFGFFECANRPDVAAAASAFVAVQVGSAASAGVGMASSDGAIELHLDHGRRLLLRPGFDGSTLAAALAVLEGADGRSVAKRDLKIAQ